jgi:hypothetical protein
MSKGWEQFPEDEGTQINAPDPWASRLVSPLGQYPRMFSPRRGWLAPLASSPLGEPGTQMFWRQQLTQSPMPSDVGTEQAQEAQKQIKEQELQKMYEVIPETLDVMPRPSVPGTRDVMPSVQRSLTEWHHFPEAPPPPPLAREPLPP